MLEREQGMRDCAKTLELVEIFRFRHEWDGFHAGFVPLEMGTLLKMFSMLLAWVAVVLQFDYRVVGSTAALADANAATNMSSREA